MVFVAKLYGGSIMKKIWENYKSTIILLVAMIVGAIIGLIAGEKATVLSPLGDLYINLLMVIIVPLVFLTMVCSIAKMKQPKRLGKVMLTIVVVIIITSIISVLVGFLSTYFVKLVDTEDGEQIKASLELKDEANGEKTEEKEEISIPDQLVGLVTVNDFSKLLSRDNIIAILVFAILFGFAINMAKEKGEPVLKFLESANEVVLNLIKITSYYAPIGLACYLAALVGTFGASIAIGYAKTFIYYNIVAIVFFIVVYTLYAFIAGKKKGVTTFWKHILAPAATALATCSSGASIPVSMEAAEKMGVSDDIATTTVSIGTNFHKDGSIIGSVFKMMFLICLFGASIGGGAGVFQILGIALLATLLVTAVPIGGGTISEMLIISMLGYPVAALPILTMVATIIDPLATVLNVTGNTVNSMLVARFVDGKDWMEKKK